MKGHLDMPRWSPVPLLLHLIRAAMNFNYLPASTALQVEIKRASIVQPLVITIMCLLFTEPAVNHIILVLVSTLASIVAADARYHLSIYIVTTCSILAVVAKHTFLGVFPGTDPDAARRAHSDDGSGRKGEGVSRRHLHRHRQGASGGRDDVFVVTIAVAIVVLGPLFFFEHLEALMVLA